MENRLDNIGKTFKVSASAPARQPMKIPPIKLKINNPGNPKGRIKFRREKRFPKVTPTITQFSIFL